jgi:hypothetical protein
MLSWAKAFRRVWIERAVQGSRSGFVFLGQRIDEEMPG